MKTIYKIIFSAILVLGLVVVATASTYISSRGSAFDGNVNVTGNLQIKGGTPWVDVKAFGAKGDGVTDDSVAFENAITVLNRQTNRGGTLYVPCGTYITTNQLYLNSTAGQAQYIIKGDGLCSYIKPKFTNGTGSTKYIFVVNENPAGARIVDYPDFPRAIFENLRFSGEMSDNASIVKTEQASIIMKQITGRYLMYGLYTEGYTDMSNMEYINWFYGRNGGFFYYQSSNGDSVRINELQLYNSLGSNGAVYKFAGINGRITNLVNGRIILESVQNELIENCHFETTKSEKRGDGIISIHNSDVILRGNYFDSRNLTPIYINDNTALTYRAKSNVKLEDNIFAFIANTAYEEVQKDIYLANFQTYSRLTLRNNVKNTFTANRQIWNTVGISIHAANAALNSTLKNNSALFSSYVDLKRINNDWKVTALTPYGDSIQTYPDISGGTISSLSTSTSTSYLGNMTNATWYYRFSVITQNGDINSVSSESSTAVTGALRGDKRYISNRTIMMYLIARQTPATIRIFKGTAPNTYTSYVEIPLINTDIELFDRGLYIEGYKWITSGVPTYSLIKNATNKFIVRGSIDMTGIFNYTGKVRTKNTETSHTCSRGEYVVNASNSKICGCTATNTWKCATLA